MKENTSGIYKISLLVLIVLFLIIQMKFTYPSYNHEDQLQKKVAEFLFEEGYSTSDYTSLRYELNRSIKGSGSETVKVNLVNDPLNVYYYMLDKGKVKLSYILNVKTLEKIQVIK